jgi:hypothetical protein
MNFPTDPILILAAIAVAVAGVGRLSRVLTYDDFPPSVWVRMQWAKLTKDGPWSKLASCQWCATPWIMLICLSWGVFSELHWSWWAFWGWLGISYLSSILIGRDEQRE